MEEKINKSRKKFLAFIIILLFSSLIVSFLVKNWVVGIGEKIKNNISSQPQSNIEIGRSSTDFTSNELEQRIKENPENADLYNIKGNEYLIKSEFEKAINEFNKAIEINPNYAEPYSGKGVAYRNLGEYNKAIENYTKAIELYPSYFEAYNNRGICYLFLDKKDKACFDFKKACELGSCSKLEAFRKKESCE